MSDGTGTVRPDGDGTAREYARTALVLGCVAVVVLATVVVPVASAVGLSGAPAASLIPTLGGVGGEGGDGDSGSGQPGDGAASGGGGSGGSLGALNAGASQRVGGSIAEDAGAFRSQNAEVHFLVRSARPAYWRTGAYDTYTGGGWERSGPSSTAQPAEGRELRYRVELEQPASAPPAVWQPRTVDGEDDLSVTAGGRLDAGERLGPGTTYVGVSRRPPRDPTVLKASGRSYPADLERRYTRLPADTRAEIAPFTDNLTADADSPYETAVRIEQWLEGTKSYSLSVAEPPDDDVATQFVFEMEEGYCEYFATSMVVMLRSQGVPARYVVGYSTGQRAGANTYKVRALNAHAWVEVYFEGVGWVRFDPTPGQARLQAEQQAVQNQTDAEYFPREEGSPGEVSSPDSSDSPSGATDPGGDGGDDPDGGGDGPGDGETGNRTGGYVVDLNRTAVPGAPVTVNVTVPDGTPVVDAVVRFNGERVGVTGYDGTVVATVPYAEQLTVTVTGGHEVFTVVNGSAARAASHVPGAGGGQAAIPGGGQSAVPPPRAGGGGGGAVAPASDPGRRFALAPGPLRGDAGRRAANESASRTYDLTTTASVALSGTPVTGNAVVVTATVESVPLRNATVFLDGTPVARTGPDGTAELTLPSAPGNVTVAVEKAVVRGETRVTVRRFRATVDPLLPLPVAGTPVEVTTWLGDRRAPNVPVAVDGERAGTTGVNGTLSVTLPARSAVTVTAARYGQSRELTLSNPLLNAGALAALALGALAGVAAVGSRRGATPGSLVALLRRWTVACYRGAVGLLVAAAVGAERALELLAARLRRALAALRAVLAGERTPGAVLADLRAWLAGLGSRSPDEGDAADAGAGAAGAASHADAPDPADEAHATVREAWGEFLEHVSARRPETKTPGQLAAHAVAEDGLPADHVATLRDEFRAVEYGPRSPDESVPRVRRALDALSAAADRNEGDDGSGAGATGADGDEHSGTSGEDEHRDAGGGGERGGD